MNKFLKNILTPWAMGSTSADKDRYSSNQPNITGTSSLPQMSEDLAHPLTETHTSHPLDRNFNLLRPSVGVGTDPIPHGKRAKISFLRNRQLSFRKRKDKKVKGQHKMGNIHHTTRHDFLLEQHIPSAPPLTSSEAEDKIPH